MSELRIAFVGTCQVAGMMAAASILLPDAYIEAQHIFVTMQPEALGKHVRSFDAVITQIGDSDPRFPDLTATAMNEAGVKAIFLPTFVFSGLHPDMTYIFDQGQVVPGAHCDVHSLLGAACYIAGCNVRQTENLFNAYVFAEIGYLDEYAISHKFMKDTYTAAGYDVDGLVEDLLIRSGPFMHTINHPTISILSYLATQALVKLNIIPGDTVAPATVPDDLSKHFVAPVFPPIARRIGLSGSTTYLKPANSTEHRELDLKDYLRQSFEIYEKLDRNVISQGRIGEVAKLLDDLLR